MSAGECNSDLWNHVYEKDRLQVIESCTSVEGRVRSLFASPDGDLHIDLDPDDKSVMNLLNLAHAHRSLVVEVVCDHPAKDADARAACAGLQSPITAPAKGDRIRVIGAYVTDSDNGWREIHPVSRMDALH